MAQTVGEFTEEFDLLTMQCGSIFGWLMERHLRCGDITTVRDILAH